MEPSEKGRLTMTAKLLQERFNRYTADPCLPQLLAVMESMSPSGVDQVDRAAGEPAEQTEAAQAPMAPWCCAFNNLGVVEKRLRTQHGDLTVESIRIGNRLRNCMYGVQWLFPVFVWSDGHLQDCSYVDDAFKVLLSSSGRSIPRAVLIAVILSF